MSEHLGDEYVNQFSLDNARNSRSSSGTDNNNAENDLEISPKIASASGPSAPPVGAILATLSIIPGSNDFVHWRKVVLPVAEATNMVLAQCAAITAICVMYGQNHFSFFH